jgi:FkbM family methyltransferase
MKNKNFKLLPKLLFFYCCKKILWILFRLKIVDFNLYIKLFELLKRKSVSIFDVGHAKLNISLLDSGMASPLVLEGRLDEYNLCFLKSRLKKGMRILDIGAHVGFYTSFFKEAIAKGGKIYCFEPDNFNFALLKKNVELNKIYNATLENFAVGSKTGFLNFYSSTNNFGDHHLYYNKALNGIRKSKRVKVVAIDDYFNEKGEKIDLVKIDVQGVEPSVVMGMAGLISKQKHIKIFAELWPPGYLAAGFSPINFIKYLNRSGFTIDAITRHGRVIKNVRNYSSLAKILEVDDFIDLYCEK